MDTFGTLEFFQGVGRKTDYLDVESYVKKSYWRVAGHQPALMLARIVSSAYHPGSGVTNVEDNISNVEHIRWLMLRYPLELKSPIQWGERIHELEQQEVKRVDMQNLGFAEPIGSRFVGVLKDFQKQGLDFLLKSNGQALLADEMGLGKGVQALAYVTSESDAFPVLVVAPLTTLSNWEREIYKFTRRVDGSMPIVRKVRSGKSGNLSPADYYLINYELLSKRVEDIEHVGIRTIISDEVQALRNRSTQRYRAIKEIGSTFSVKHRVGLSGTPVYNHGQEIWGIVDFLYPGLLGDYAEFCHEFVNDWNGKVYEDKREALYEILVKDIMLRRRKTDVLKELPKMTRYREKIQVDLEYYDREMRGLLQRIDEQIGKGNTSLTLINQQQNLLAAQERQIAGVAKIPFVVDFVKEMMELEESIVVFVHHHVVHQLLHEKLADFYPVSIIGGQSDVQRQDAIDRFQKGGTKLLIAGLRAGNLGINLTAASYIVFGELDWSPAVHRQAEGRLDRIGQERPMFAYYLEGLRTYDEHIAELLVDKKLELDSILGDTPETEQNMDERTRDLLSFVKGRLGQTLDISADSKQEILDQREDDMLAEKDVEER